MRSTRTATTRSVVRVWLALGAVLATTIGGLTGLARAADEAPSPLRMEKILSQTDFTGHPYSLIPIGIDGALGKAVFYSGEFNVPGRLNLVDTAQMKETSAIPTDDLSGKPSSYALDTQRHLVYISGQVGTQTPGCSAGAPVSTVCGAASPAVKTPSIETVNLLTGATHLLTLPPEAAGQDIVTMSAISAAGHSLVYALLFSDPIGSVAKGVGSSLTLYAFDTTALPSAQSGPVSVLWSYPLTSCAGLFSAGSGAVLLGGGQQDYLGVDPAGRFVYFACRGLLEYSSNTHVTPSGAVVVAFPAEKPFALAQSTDGFATEFYPNGSAAKFGISAGDATRGLLYLASTGSRNYVRVFNAQHRAWTGSVPFASGSGSNLSGIGTDPVSSRAYIYYQSPNLISAETAQLPVDLGTEIPLGTAANTKTGGSTPLIDPVTHHMFLPGRPDDSPSEVGSWQILSVLTDTRPVVPPAADIDPDADTHQVDLTPETEVSYSGFASAYGAKAIAFGSEHLGEYSQKTPSENLQAAGSTCTSGLHQDAIPACTSVPPLPDGTRSIVVGQVENTELSNSAAKANATALAIDDTTHGNLTTLSSTNLNTLVSGIPGLPTPQDLGASLPDATQQYAPASCGDFGGKRAELSGPGSTALCDHTGQQAGGAAVSPLALQQEQFDVATAASSTRVGRTADNQVETIANAIARGIRITVPGGPTVTIGEVSALASSVAAGRTGTAKSSYSRRISQVTVEYPAGTVKFRCGFEDDADANCDPRQLTSVVDQYSPFPVLFLTPSPDLDPRVKASPGGAQAAITKTRFQYWNDYFTSGDNAKEVPGLQVVMVADQDQPSRLTLNLAGLRVESHDAIGLPPVAPAPLPLPSLELTLLDDATPPVALSGATFAVQGSDDDAKPLTCQTAADGIGTCSFKELVPGTYTISEKTPPPGYAAVEDYELTLEAGKDYKTTFVNLPAIGSVEVSLLSPAKVPEPIPDAQFAIHTGASILETPIVTCATDDHGECTFQKVPLGDYTMEQVSAPGEFIASAPVAFSLTKPAQVARLHFVDGLPGKEAVPPRVIPGEPAVPPTVVPGKPAVPPRVIPGKPAVPGRTMVLPAVGGDATVPALEPAGYEEALNGPPPVVASQPSGLDALSLGSGGLRAVSARLAKLVIHSPQQAVLLLFVWLVLGLPAYLWVRRQQFVTATEGI